jgi:hypothetical protein
MTAGGFSMYKVASTEKMDETSRQEAITAALLQSEAEILAGRVSDSDQSDPLLREGSDTDVVPIVQESATASEVSAPPDSSISTDISGVVELVSAAVLNVTMVSGEKMPVWLGSNALETAAEVFPEFSVQNGDLVQITGYWSDSGSYIVETITNETTGLTLDLAVIRSTMDVETENPEAAPDTTRGRGNGQGNGQGNGYRGGGF